MKNELMREREKQINQLKLIKKKLGGKSLNCSTEKLWCNMNKGKSQYYIDGRYISKKKLNQAKELAEKEYYTQIIPKIENGIKMLSQTIAYFESNPIDQVYNKYNQARKELLINNQIRSTTQMISDFENMNCENEQFIEITTDIYTLKGEKVRSKSEKIIADALFKNEIPYKYELPLTLYENGRAVKIHPDFTVLNKNTARRYYIEHLGMMSDEKYYANTMSKLSLYEKNNMLIGRELLLFHETTFQPLNTLIIDEYIKEYLL